MKPFELEGTELLARAICHDFMRLGCSTGMPTSSAQTFTGVRTGSPELLARAICHELDHLEGRLYVDKVEGPLQDVRYDEEAEDEGAGKRGYSGSPALECPESPETESVRMARRVYRLSGKTAEDMAGGGMQMTMPINTNI